MTATCEPLTGRTTAFDTRCTFQLDPAWLDGSDLTLLLDLLPRRAPPRTELYKVRLVR